MDDNVTYKGAVMTWECDSNGHMNVMYYVNKFELAGRNFNIGLGLTDFGHKSNIGMVVLEQNIKYLKEVFEDDLLFMRSHLIDLGNKTFTIFHEMYNTRTNDIVSSMRVVCVLFDKKERKALALPGNIKDFLQKKLKDND